MLQADVCAVLQADIVACCRLMYVCAVLQADIMACCRPTCVPWLQAEVCGVLQADVWRVAG